MTDITHILGVSITLIGSEETEPEPGVHVAKAIKHLLEDTMDDWLSEAMGYPYPESFNIEVKSLNTVIGSKDDGETSKTN